VILYAIGDCGKKLNRNIQIEKNECAQMKTNVEMGKYGNMEIGSCRMPIIRLFS
jgi:hypothetical protein